MKRIDGGEIVCRVLTKHRVGTVFALHGGHLDAIFLANTVGSHGIRFVDTRHEASAGHAAEGYARSTGEVGVAMATAGPGFTNIITSMTNAWLDCTPVVYICGASPLREAEMNPLQGGIDQIAMVKSVTKWAGQASRIELIGPLLERCISTARSGRPGPVFLEIPIDVLFDLTDDAVPLSDSVFFETISHAAPSTQTVAGVVSMLRVAKRPVLCAGGGALFAKCAEPLRKFVGKTGIPVYTNNKAHGVLPFSDSLACGKISNMGALKEDGGARPDLIIMLGARFGLFTGGDNDAVIPGDAKIIQVDIEPREFGRVRAVDLPVQSDCRAFIEATCDALGEDWRPVSREWQDRVMTTRRWHRVSFADVLDKTDGLIHPYFLSFTVAEVFGRDAVYVSDGGNTNNWTELNTEVDGPGQFHAFGYLGCLGVGPGMAVGAQLAHQDKKVVLQTGDGAIGLNLSEWDTMVRHDLPIVTVVANNAGWGMSFQSQDLTWPEGVGHVISDLNPTRYDQVAEGFGCHVEHVTGVAELKPALERARDAGKPAVVNVTVDPEPISPQLLSYVAIEEADGEEIVLPYYKNISGAKR